MKKRVLAGLFVAASVTAGLESKDFKLPESIKISTLDPEFIEFQKTQKKVNDETAMYIKSFVIDPLVGIFTGVATIGVITMIASRRKNKPQVISDQSAPNPT